MEALLSQHDATGLPLGPISEVGLKDVLVSAADHAR